MPSHSILALLFAFAAQAASAPSGGSAAETRTLVAAAGDAKVPVNYEVRAATGQKFDPALPTVVYVSGGPSPFSVQSPNKVPVIFPKDVQVIVMDYIGVAHANRDFPRLKDRDVLAHLTSTGQANVIRAVVKKEKLGNYVIWGESLGGPVALRAVNSIQTDAAISAKPVAVVVDSGAGRRVTEADLAAKAKRCGASSPVGPMRPGSSEDCQPHGFSPPTVQEYPRACYPKKPSARSVSTLLQTLQGFGFPDNPGVIQSVVGCPPIDRIDYSLWQYAMACGMFTPEARKQTTQYCEQSCRFPNCGKTVSKCLKRCANLPVCADSPLDVADLQLGKTAVLGIQAQDDCQGFPTTMDYLMSHLGGNEGYYVSVPKGGHVTYEPRPGAPDLWKACHDQPSPIFEAIFAGKVRVAGQWMRGCYGGPAAEGPEETGEPPQGARAAE